MSYRLIVLTGFASLTFGATPARLTAQVATFSGTVLTESDERHLPNAEIVFPTLGKSVRSDSVGNFVVTGIPPGTHAVIVRLVGYATTTSPITFRPGERVEADLVMRAVVTRLDTVKVHDRPRDIRLRDFEERRVAGLGRFLTTDVFEKNSQRQLAEVLIGSIPGSRAIGRTNEKWLAAGRGPLSGAPCYVQVIVNDVAVYTGRPNEPMFDVNAVNTADVLAVEYYTPSTTPLRFNRTGGGGGNAAGAACGTLVIWQK